MTQHRLIDDILALGITPPQPDSACQQTDRLSAGKGSPCQTIPTLLQLGQRVIVEQGVNAGNQGTVRSISMLGVDVLARKPGGEALLRLDNGQLAWVKQKYLRVIP